MKSKGVNGWFRALMLFLFASVMGANGAVLGIANGGFESGYQVSNREAATKDIRFGSWHAGENKRIPSGWILNPAYPGSIDVVMGEGAPEGKSYIRVKGDIDAKYKRGAQMHNAANGLEVGKRYILSAKIRNGKASIGFYEYKQDKSMRAVTVAAGEAGAEWKEISGEYQVPEGFRNAYAVLMIGYQESVEIDDVVLKEVSGPVEKIGETALTLENEMMKLELSKDARLKHFFYKASGQDIAFADSADSICHVKHKGLKLHAKALTVKDGQVSLVFPDPSVKVAARIQAAKRYFTIEVTQVEPSDLEAMTWEFPIKKLGSKSTITSAVFDKTFVTNLFALNFMPYCTVHEALDGSMRMTADFLPQHGYVGGKFAVLGMPRKDFFGIAKEVEADAGLPSPKLDGKWLRESDPIRRSYMMVVDMKPGDLDTLIRYAKLGGFQTIVFDKDSWLESHGHYLVNKKNFPQGFKAAADKIHAAGLKVGVHLFGPSISPNDPYMSPVPDKRLASVPCPPLAKAISAEDTVLTFAKRPESLTNAGFPENHLQIGDEIIRYGKMENGTPFRFVDCVRGAHGTKAAAHPAGSEVKGLITKLEFSMLVPKSELLDEVASHFAKVVNECKIDLVYFDASDCEIHARPMGYDLRRYVDQCHYTFYRKFDHDVLYQTSVGLGFNMQWHIVARGASANGFGDIKKQLAKHMRITRYTEHFAFADVGWYGLDPAIRLNAIEYIASKCLACDGSISVQGGCRAWESHPQGREIFEMLNRYEQARFHRVFGMDVAETLLDKEKDFRLYGSQEKGWKLFEASFTPDHYVEKLDGTDNAWTIENPWDTPQEFALEVLRFPVYTSPNTVVLEDFTNLAPFKTPASGQNPKSYSRFVKDAGLAWNHEGGVTAGSTASLGHQTYPQYFRTHTGVFTVRNDSDKPGTWILGKEFPQPVDISRCRNIAFWLRGYNMPADFTLQLVDAKGKSLTRDVKLDYLGWRLHFFGLADKGGIDLSSIKHLVIAIRNIPPRTRNWRSTIAGIQALPGTSSGVMSNMELVVNGKSIKLPGSLAPGQSLTTDSLGNCTLWGGGMKPGRTTALPASTLKLAPGANKIEFRHKTGAKAGRGVMVRLIPLKKVAEVSAK